MGGIGGTIGGILGGVAGTAIAGPAGTTAGASLGTGIGQLIEGRDQKKKAKGMTPSPEDVGERALLNTLRRRRQALSTGTAYNPQVVAGQQMAKAMQRNAFAAGGPVNQGMYSGLIGQTMGNIAQQTSQDIANTLGVESQTIKGMADTKRDLTLLQRNEMMADAAQNIKDSGQNIPASYQPSGEVKEGGAADLSGVASSLYSENETLKKKLKEIEEQQKKAAEATGTTGGK